jgi:hypothetical protein
MNSAMGERQILPWQMNKTLINALKLLKPLILRHFCFYNTPYPLFLATAERKTPHFVIFINTLLIICEYFSIFAK